MIPIMRSFPNGSTWAPCIILLRIWRSFTIYVLKFYMYTFVTDTNSTYDGKGHNEQMYSEWIKSTQGKKNELCVFHLKMLRNITLNDEFLECYSVNHLDIAPQFASILMGLSNTVATLPGMFSPLLTGHLVQDKVSVKFLVSLMHSLLCGSRSPPNPITISSYIYVSLVAFWWLAPH